MRPERTRSTPADPATGQAPEDRAADQDGAGAQGEGLEDVGAAADAAVDVDLDPVADRGGDLGEGVGGGDGGVELAAAVVGDHHPGGAGVHAGDRVVGAQDPLDHDREAGAVGQPGDDVGGEGGVELAGLGEHVDVQLALAGGPDRRGVGGLEAGRQPEPVAEVAQAVAEQGHVDGQDQRPVAGGGGPCDQVGRPAAVADHVDLEPADGVGGGRRHLLDRHGGLGREHVQGAGRGRPGGRGGLAVGVDHAVVGHGRDHQRGRDLAAEQGRWPSTPGSRRAAPGGAAAAATRRPGCRPRCARRRPRPRCSRRPRVQPGPGRRLQRFQVQRVERVQRGGSVTARWR